MAAFQDLETPYQAASFWPDNLIELLGFSLVELEDVKACYGVLDLFCPSGSVYTALYIP